MKIGRYLFVGLLAVLVLFSGLTRSAYARHKGPNQKYTLNRHILGKHHAPKKLKSSKHQFRSPVTGNLIYGKPVKQK